METTENSYRYEEQYRSMAIIEAAFRVKDNTGFDMTIYKQHFEAEQRRQREVLEKQQQQQQQRIKPKPRINDSYRADDNGISSGPQEPQLPFTRANRSYVKIARARKNRDQPQASEISPGITIQNSEQFIVKCWGCNSNLRPANVLATLVRCPNCMTVSPVIMRSKSERNRMINNAEKIKR